MLEFNSEYWGATYEIIFFSVWRVQLKRREWGAYTTDMTKENRCDVRNTAIICLPGFQWCFESMLLQCSYRLRPPGITMTLLVCRPNKGCIPSSALQRR